MRHRQWTLDKWILTTGALLALAAPVTNVEHAQALSLAVWCPPPDITGQPQSATACVGGSVTFTVVAEGDPPLEYQWRKDGVPIILANEPSYTIDGVTPAHAGIYDVEVTNPCGSTISAPATLTVINEGPGILQHPQSQEVCAGDAVTFTVTPDGPGPFTYQWRKDEVPIIGAEQDSYTIDPVAPEHAGDYDVVVTNPCDAVTSDAATLTVLSGPTIVVHPQSADSCSGDAVTFSVEATGAEPLGYQWRKDGNDIPDANEPTYAIDPVEPNDAGVYDVVVANPCDPNGVVSDPAALAVVEDVPIVTSDHPPLQTVCIGDPVTFSVTATPDVGLSYQWYKDGVPIILANEPSYVIESAAPAHAGVYDVLVRNPCGSVMSDPATLAVINEGPGILEHPQSQLVCTGEPQVTFTVTLAGGDEPISYQWRKDSVDIPGATTDTLIIADVDPNDAGSYDVVVANPCDPNGVVSDAATLTVLTEGPTVTQDPNSLNVCEGLTATFSVVATPPEGLSYQWREDSVDLPGETSDTLTIDPVEPNDAGTYDVVVTNPCGSIISDPATLHVEFAPTISEHPSDQAVCEGQAVTFSVTAAGDPPPEYQWRKDSVDIPGETSDTLTIEPLEPNDAGVYDVVVSNHCGQATSNGATLTVNLKPSILEHPETQHVCEHAAVTFTVVATGHEPLSYQWRKDTVEISEATAATYAIASLELDDAGQYDVIVMNPCDPNGVVSAAATLTIEPLPRVTQQPEPGIIARGQSHEFCVVATGAGLSYQWQKDGEDIPYATGRCYEASEAGWYRCVVSNVCGSTPSDTAELEIAPLVTVGASASPTAIKVGDSSTLTAAAAAGLPPYSYEWSTGQSGPSIVVSPSESTVYTVTATDSLGQTATTDATVTVAEPITVAVRASAFTIAPGESSTLTALAWGGLRPFTYRWSTGQTGVSITVRPTETTTYTVTVTDPLGQKGSASATVAVEEPTTPPTEPPEGEGEEEPGQAEEEQPPADTGEPNAPADEAEADQPTTGGLCPAVGLIAFGLTLVGLWRTRGPRTRRLPD